MMKRILHIELTNCYRCPSFAGYIKDEGRYECEFSGWRCAPSAVGLFENCPLPLVESIKPEKIDTSTEQVASGDMKE